MKYSIIIVFFSVLFLVSCKDNKQEIKTIDAETEQVKEEWKPEMYKTSPLASLMREMYKVNSERKEMLLNSISFGDTLNNFRSLHTATPTEERDNTPLFHAYAETHIKSDSLMSIQYIKEKKIQAFNNHVNTCIACHENFCMGPIGKIKTLLINN